MEFRTEKDSLGEVKVPCDKYYGAQTERSRNNFKFDGERMPLDIIHAFGIIKEAAARANAALKPEKMTEEKLSYIVAAAKEVASGGLDEHFPLVIFQTGSGTQSNMNANEVIANRGNFLAGKSLLHPNDDVNMSQSSNDTFPTAMNVAAVLKVEKELKPAINELIEALITIEKKYASVIKCGRTHLQDAVPITFGEEASGWRASLEEDEELILSAIDSLRPLALGGTAVGTSLNAPKGFGEKCAEIISEITGSKFSSAENKYHALSSKGEFVAAHGALKALAADLIKIANDIRWLASGPRLGLGEITIPANEPGSSIMPGKVNPTQCESVTMVCAQVFANDSAVSFGASQGNFELNVYMPLIASAFLRSVSLLAHSIKNFTVHCVSGLTANEDKMRENVENSLMLATALNPVIGYEKAAKTVQLAFKENLTLKEAAVRLGFLTEKEFDSSVNPSKMV